MIAKNYIFGRKYGANFLTNLVAYYPLNSNANDVVNGYNGSQVGSPTYTSGKVSNAINFGNDTTNRYFDIADKNDFSFTNGTTDVPFTISLWVNCSGLGAIGNWFINKRGGTSGTDEWQFIFYGNRVEFAKFQFNNNAIAQQIATPTGVLPLNTWTHFTYTDNGSGAVGSGKMYRNGVLNTNINQNVGGTYTRMNNSNSIVKVGINAWSPSTHRLKHRGLIDELAIWKNRELTATEVLELYTKGNAGTPLI